jgi:hypothetical protein
VEEEEVVVVEEVVGVDHVLGQLVVEDLAESEDMPVVRRV